MWNFTCVLEQDIAYISRFEKSCYGPRSNILNFVFMQIELKLKKKEGIRWEKLECDPGPQASDGKIEIKVL